VWRYTGHSQLRESSAEASFCPSWKAVDSGGVVDGLFRQPQGNTDLFVTPAKAGVQRLVFFWIPAFAGMTNLE